jgi:hypothetical protein
MDHDPRADIRGDVSGGGLMVSGSGIQAVQAVFLLLLVFVAMFAGLARRLKVPIRSCS